MITGIAASSGYCKGRAFVYEQQKLAIDETPISAKDVEREIEKFRAAKEAAGEQIVKIRERAQKLLTEEECKVFDAHLMLLEDPSLDKRVIKYIGDKLIKAEYALDLTEKELYELFQCMENEVMKERCIDIRDVCTRILYLLKNLKIDALSDLEENTIVVAENLTPSDTVQMDLSKVAAIVTDMGGRTSHVAIIARSLEIPAVVGAKEATKKIRNGQTLWLDGNQGRILLEPSHSEIELFESERKAFDQRQKELKKYASMESHTLDGRSVEICANIGSYPDAGASMKFGPDGVGLFRTEFLYMGRHDWPTEKEQFNEYKKVAELMKDRATIIRTLDIGGDKALEYIDFGEEENPFLGWRAIRVCLDKTEIFKTQLRAILRASAFGKIKIMYPMIINTAEIQKANTILHEAKEELRREKVVFDEGIETGIMVETPAAALTADVLIKYVDFFSIGTNDLTQYTLAVDRGNEKITDLYAPYHPAVLRLIKMVADASHKAGKWTGMCGELAGSDEFTKVLVGIGLDELSMTASSILKVRKNVVNIKYNEAKQIAEKVLKMETAEDVLHYVQEKGSED